MALKADKVLVRYIIQGLIFQILGWVLFIGLILGVPQVEPVIFNVITAISLFPFSFIANRRFVFRSRADARSEGFRFVVTYALSLVIGACSFVALYSIYPEPVVVQWAVIVIRFLFSFSLNRWWTFDSVRQAKGRTPKLPS